MFAARKTRVTAIASIAAATMLLTACNGTSGGEESGASGDENVTLTYTWWGNDDRAARMEQAIDAFEAEHPNIKINGSFTDYEGYWQKRATEAAGGSLPDVMQFDYSYVSEYGKRNLLLDLAKQSDLDLSAFEDSVLESGQIGDMQVAVATGTNTWGLFYNEDVLTAAGVDAPTSGMSWDEFNAWMTTASATGATAGGQDYTQNIQMFQLQLRQQGKDLFDEDGQLAFDKDDLRDFWNSVDDERSNGAIFPADQAEQLLPKSPFGSGKTGSEFSWDNFMNGYVGDTGTDNIQLVAPPSDGDDLGLYLKPALMMASSSKTSHPEEAAIFLNFMLNDPGVGEIFGASRGIPASQTQLDGVKFEGNDQKVYDYEQSVKGAIGDAPVPPIKGFGTLEANFKRITGDIDHGALTIDEAVDEWFAEAEQVISDNG